MSQTDSRYPSQASTDIVENMSVEIRETEAGMNQLSGGVVEGSVLAREIVGRYDERHSWFSMVSRHNLCSVHEWHRILAK